MAKKIFSMVLCALLVSILMVTGKHVNAEGGYTATKTDATIGTADGIKDEAYSAAVAIPVTHVAWESENATPATANMYLLWDQSYLYVFAEVTDDNHYGYQEGTWLEFRDAFEMFVDLYHNTSYQGGYGGDYRGDKMCEGMYKISAGVGQASVNANVQGTHWLWDSEKDKGSYASALTETGYTVEFKIALGKDAAEYMVAEREIGIGVKIYDKHADDKDTSKTVLEGKNDGQQDGPRNLSTVKLVGKEVIVPTVPTATQTHETLGAADGVKDEAYNAATVIPVTHVAWESENATPATANMYLLWDQSYLYVFAEVTDDNHYGYQEGTWLEFRDAFEMFVDLYHNTSYQGGYGGDYRGDKMCEGMYKISAGVGQASVNANVQGTHWLWDSEKDKGSYASALTETGYTVEFKIALGKDAAEYMVAEREIGIGVKIYDKHADDKDTSKTVLEGKNDGQQDGPRNLSTVKLVGKEVIVPTVPTATKTDATIGVADGVKDAAYNAAAIIPVTYVAWESGNPSPATANLYLLWDQSYLYVFAEVTDNRHYNYQPGTWLEFRDAFEMLVDLYHNTSYQGGYGGDYRGDKMCEGFYKISAGVGQATLNENVQGTHWMWDSEKDKGSYASVLTDTGYTVEFKIALGKDAAEYMVAEREIGLGVKIYDKYADDKDTSKTVLEGKNDGLHDGPRNLSTIKLVEADSEYLAAYAKVSAQKVLAAYKSADLYRDAEKTELAALVQSGNNAIELAITSTEVATALANAKAAIDALKTAADYAAEELAAAKVSAKAELASYKSSDLYRDAEKAQLASIIESGNSAIDATTSHEEVATALANAKAAIDALKTNEQYELEEQQGLEALKANVLVELASYKSEDLYRDAEKAQLAEIVAAATENINNASDYDSVYSLLANAKAAIDALKTAEEYEVEEFEAYKSNAKTELETYKSADDYRAVEKAELARIIESGKNAIDSAESIEDVNNALASAKAAIDGLKTKAEYEAEADKYTATKTFATIGTADGIKDAAYNVASVITISHVAWEEGNATPATANMYLLWDESYLYVFVEVLDDNHYGYEAGTWLEFRDAFEMYLDLYHNTDYVGGYGDGYRGDKMCEGLYKISAGVGQATVNANVQGTHWLWDDQKDNGSYASALTETGYTVEFKIALGKDAAEYMVVGREIGIGVKIYDKHADDKNTSKTVLEAKNDGQHDGPHNLTTIKLVNVDESEEALHEVKTSSKAELDAYKSLDAYYEAEQALLVAALEAGKAAIDAATSIDDVIVALSNAKATIDSIKTIKDYEDEAIENELNTLRNAAIAELESYKSVSDYRDSEATTYLSVIQQAKTAIAEATTQDAINTVVANAKTAIDSIKTKVQYEAEELIQVKETAKTQLETYKSLDGLSDSQKTEVANKVSEGKAAIDAATTEEEVNSALANAKTALDAIQPAPAKEKGCLGSIATTIFGMITLAAFVLILGKKKNLVK